MSRKTPRELSIREQKELLVCYDVANLEYVSKHRAAQILNVSRATLKTLLENRAAVEGRAEQTDDGRRAMTLDDVEKCLFQFFVHMINSNAPVTDDVLLGKARAIAAQFGLKNFVPTSAWLIYWKYKNSVPFQPVADHKTDFNRLANEKWLLDLVRYTRTSYDADRVYGLVETGLYRWAAGDSNAAATAASPDGGGGGDRRVQRLSVVFLCNITGTDKKRPLVIDRDDGGRGGGNAAATSFNALKTAHYTTFLKRWSHELWPNKILLILDNRSAHPTVGFRNIEIKYLPKNVVHPLGRHIVRVAKTYEDRCAQPTAAAATATATAAADDDMTTTVRWDYTVSEYVSALLNTWDRVSPAVVRDCFRAIGFETGATTTAAAAERRVESPNAETKKPVSVISHTSRAAPDGPRPQDEQILPLNLCKKDVRPQRKRKNDHDDNIPRTVTNVGQSWTRR